MARLEAMDNGISILSKVTVDRSVISVGEVQKGRGVTYFAQEGELTQNLRQLGKLQDNSILNSPRECYRDSSHKMTVGTVASFHVNNCKKGCK